MAKAAKGKGKKRVKVGVDVKISGGGKGRGAAKIVPTLTIERDSRTRVSGGRAERKGPATAEHLVDLQIEELTPAAKRIAAGDRVTVLGPGPRLVVLSARGALGLASREASEALRAALSAAPGASLESRVSTVGEEGVSVSVTLVGAPAIGRRDGHGGRPLAKPAVRSVAAMAASSRRRR